MSDWEAAVTAIVAGQLAAASGDCEQSGSLLAAVLSHVYLKAMDASLQQLLLQPKQESQLAAAAQEAVALFAVVTPPENAVAAWTQCWQALHSALMERMEVCWSRHTVGSTVNTLPRALLQHSAVAVGHRLRAVLDVCIEIANGNMLAHCSLHNNCEALIKGRCVSQTCKTVEHHPQLQKILWNCGECGLLDNLQLLCMRC